MTREEKVIKTRKRHYAIVDTSSVITYISFKHFHGDNLTYYLLQMPWTDVVKHDSVDDALNAWMTIFADVYDIHGPIKRRKAKAKT